MFNQASGGLQVGISLRQVLEAAKQELTLENAQRHFGKKIQSHARPQELVASTDFQILPRQIQPETQVCTHGGAAVSNRLVTDTAQARDDDEL